MEVDAMPVVMEKPLRRVMDAENGEVEGILGRLVIAIHAAFLDSGFVVSDGLGSRLPRGWSSALSSLSIQYTVPEIVGRHAKDAVFKFFLLGNYVTLYGYLAAERPDVHRVCLDVSHLAPLLSSAPGTLCEMQEAGALQLWNVLKDGLCLPLLIDVCLDNHLPLPPCFTALSADLKMKILEFIPGWDAARVGCTCSELKFLSSDESLWKKKFEQEFAAGESSTPDGSWRERYARVWIAKKNATKDAKRKFPIFGQTIRVVPPGMFHPGVPHTYVDVRNSQGPSIRNTRIRIPSHLGGYNAGFRG